MTGKWHNAWTVVKVALARMRFLSVFVIAALLVGNWPLLANRLDQWTRPTTAPDLLAGESDVEYYCPMDGAVEDHPGPCPNCGMPLVKRKKGVMALPTDVLARVQLSPERLSLGNVRTSTIGYRTLSRQFDAPGLLDYDQTRVVDLSARVAGRVDTLYVNYLGQAVHKGEPVYALYSPDVFTALREYLQARLRMQAMDKSAGPDATPTAAPDAMPDTLSDAMALQQASAQKLELWGIEPGQLDKITADFARTHQVPTDIDVLSPIDGVVIRKNILQGGYVQSGDAPFAVADLRTLWLQARVYETQLAMVHVGSMAQVSVDALPGETFAGKVTFLAVAVDPATRSLDARIALENAEYRLRPGEFATAHFDLPVESPAAAVAPVAPVGRASARRNGPDAMGGTTSADDERRAEARPTGEAGEAQPRAAMVLAVPRSAVIDTGAGTVVYLRSGTGQFDERRVQLGMAAGEWYPLVSGLKEGDQVVTQGAFLVDAETRLSGNNGDAGGAAMGGGAMSGGGAMPTPTSNSPVKNVPSPTPPMKMPAMQMP